MRITHRHRLHHPPKQRREASNKRKKMKKISKEKDSIFSFSRHFGFIQNFTINKSVVDVTRWPARIAPANGKTDSEACFESFAEGAARKSTIQ